MGIKDIQSRFKKIMGKKGENKVRNAEVSAKEAGVSVPESKAASMQEKPVDKRTFSELPGSGKYPEETEQKQTDEQIKASQERYMDEWGYQKHGVGKKILEDYMMKQYKNNKVQE